MRGPLLKKGGGGSTLKYCAAETSLGWHTERRRLLFVWKACQGINRVSELSRKQCKRSTNRISKSPTIPREISLCHSVAARKSSCAPTVN